MTLFVRKGNSYIPSSEEDLVVHSELPVGNYIIEINPNTNQMFYTQVDSFHESGKVYGKIPNQCNRILNTFSDRPKSTGIMLSGDKGSGKTLLARLLCVKAAQEHNMPTIIVNMPYRGDKFNKLIQDLTQPAIVLFDEFEKVYNREEQEEILTLFDGVFPTKKMFIVTCNDKYRLDTNMRNRPGRFFYMFDFEGVGIDVINEYCEEKLNDKSHIQTICRVSTLFSSFNFDILKAMVEEMNRYNETPHQVLEYLNAKPFMDDDNYYTISLIIDGNSIDNDNFHPNSWRGNPVSNQNIELCYYEPKAQPTHISIKNSEGDLAVRLRDTDEEEDYKTHELHILPTHLKHIDTDVGTYTYMLNDRIRIKFARSRTRPVNYTELSAF